MEIVHFYFEWPLTLQLDFHSKSFCWNSTIPFSAEFFEGDIKLTPKQKKALKAALSSNKKEAITGKRVAGVGMKWENGRVPYVLANNFGK